MTALHDDVLDDGLQSVTDATTALYICNADPVLNYTQATDTFAVGNKTPISVGAPEDGDSSGRKVVIPAVTDGDVTATDTATHWALVDTVNSKVLASKALGSSQAVTNGNIWTLPAMDITIPDAA